MRLIQATLVKEDVKALTIWLEHEDLDYVLLPEEKEKFSHLLMLPVEDSQVDEVLSKLKGMGVDSEGYLTVSEVEAVVSEKIEKKQAEAERKGKKPVEKISREEIMARANELSRSTINFMLFTLLSAIVATAGLLMDSASVVVGSMVIAPLIGPAMASSVGSVVRDDELFKRGVTTQVSGILLAIAGSAIFSLLVRVLTAPQLDLMLINQVAERVHPGILSLMVALAAGVAGALSLTSGASAALVGVMIAVALIPPAATMGLGIAYLNGVIVFSAGGLVVLNMISINLAALITLWLKGYRPEKFFEEKAARGITFKRVFILLGAVIVIALFLGVTTIYERQAMEIKYNLLETARQAKVNVIDYRFTYRTNWLFRQPSGVILTVEDLSENQKKTLKKYITENYPQLKLITTYQSMERIN